MGRWKQWAGLQLEGKVRMAEVQDEAAAAGRADTGQLAGRSAS